jgi:processive 1,2-diacylglycerol beta-glucosyltransferase
MPKVLITSTRWGHASIAKAIKEVLDTKYQVEMQNVEVEPFSKISYRLIYKFFPGFFKFVYYFATLAIFRQLFYWYVEKDYMSRLETLISKFKPDIVINVYFAFDSSLAKLKTKYHFRLVNVLADPVTFSPILISKAGENLTFDSPKTGLPVGWFIEKKYYQIQNRDRNILRESLGLNPNLFTLTVTSGSEGTFNIFKILSTFLNPKYKIQIVILCGNNKDMFSMVNTLKSLAEKIGGPKIVDVAYTESMQDYLRAADLVIGKAGPNTLFQSVATLTPFFAISHISGQEDGNLDIIRKYKIGFVEENPQKATQKLKEIIENPKALTKFTPNLRSLAKYCQGSEKKLLTLLKR